MLRRSPPRICLLLLIASLLVSLIHAQDTTPTPTNAQISQSSESSSPTNTNTSKNTKETGSDSKSLVSTTSMSSVSVNPVDAPGGVSMITPAPTDQSSTYYKIGATVTLSWNYTSVQVDPTAIAVEAYCATNKFYYPIASNLTMNETHILWDTEAYEANATQPLLTAMYTLYIFDQSRSVTAIPSAGYLGSYNGYVFGMYEPQPYTPLPTNTCVICSNAPPTLLPKGIWWSLGLAAAAVLGGLRVIAL